MSNQLISLINKGYDELKSNQVNQTINTWNEAYKQLKTDLKQEKISFLQLGNLFGFKTPVGKWLKDAANLYIENKLYDEAISFNHDIINDFIEDKYLDEFQINIGKALFLKGDTTKSYEHFEQLLKKYPNDLEIIYAYLSCLKTHDNKRAKDIILKYVPLTLEYNSQSEPLFSISKAILKELNENELVKQYQNVNKIQGDFGKRKPVAKKVTVGRNDPCPCGSGKKYKKCCGR